MNTGSIPLASLPSAFDLQSTLESGQTYLWTREDGSMYETDGAHGGDAWYATVVDGEVVRVRQTTDELRWESTTDADALVRSLLRLDDDLEEIRAAANTDDIVDAAYDRYWGMRVVSDPFFGCLVSFICSAQMRVERIFGMQEALRETYGERIEADDRTYYAFPTPDDLAAATEDELRDLGLGYRAPYVQRTADLVASGDLTRDDVVGYEYEDARDAMTGFVGVGEKVADCVLLFSLDYLEAIPLDTWLRTAIEDYYPDCATGDYAATSRALRDQFGPYAGYTQTYLFHHLRNGGGS